MFLVTQLWSGQLCAFLEFLPLQREKNIQATPTKQDLGTSAFLMGLSPQDYKIGTKKLLPTSGLWAKPC